LQLVVKYFQVFSMWSSFFKTNKYFLIIRSNQIKSNIDNNFINIIYFINEGIYCCTLLVGINVYQSVFDEILIISD